LPERDDVHAHHVGFICLVRAALDAEAGLEGL
jgi:hypothetical protein